MQRSDVALTEAVVPGLTRRDQERPLSQRFCVDPNDSEPPDVEVAPGDPPITVRFVPLIDHAPSVAASASAATMTCSQCEPGLFEALRAGFTYDGPRI